MLSVISTEKNHDYVIYQWAIMHKGKHAATYTVKVHDESPQFGEIHNIVYRWTKEIYLEFLMDFEEIKKCCAAEGVTYLVAGKTKEIPKWEKYINLFGFNIVDSPHMATIAICPTGE